MTITAASRAAGAVKTKTQNERTDAQRFIAGITRCELVGVVLMTLSR